MLNSYIRKAKEWIVGKNMIRYTVFILFLLGLIDATMIPAPVATLFVLLASRFPGKTSGYIVWSIAGIAFGSVISYFTGIQMLDISEGNSQQLPVFLTNIIPGLTREGFSETIRLYSEWNHLILFFASFSPFPYVMFALASGALHTNVFIFILVVIISHLLKFILLSLFINKPLKQLIMIRKLRTRSITAVKQPFT